MNQTELPLLNDENWIDFPDLRVWCEMLYPDDRMAAAMAWEAIRREELAKQDGLQLNSSRVVELVQKDMVKAFNLGKLCGLVARQVRWNYEKRGQAFVNRAVFVVSRQYETQKTVSGGNIPTDGNRLRKLFTGKYHKTLHLWASFVLLEEKYGDGAFFNNPERFEQLLILAADMQNFFLETEALGEMELLRIPSAVGNKLENWEVIFPTEPATVEQLLREYHEDFTR